MKARNVRTKSVLIAAALGGLAVFCTAIFFLREQTHQSRGADDSSSREKVAGAPASLTDGSGRFPNRKERPSDQSESETAVITLVEKKDDKLSSMKDWDADSIRETFGMEKKGKVWLPVKTLAEGVSGSGGSGARNTGSGPISENDGASPLYLTTGSLSPGIEGEPYRASLEAVGGTLPYFWEIDAGSLPEGLQLNPIEGIISGTAEAPGSFDFRVRVMDSNEQSDIGSFTIAMESQDTLRILTETLPDALRDEAFAEQLLATGGTEPLSWSVDSVLPDGIVLQTSGTLEGTPEVAGRYRILLRVTDADGANATQRLQWTITDEDEKSVTGFEALRGLRRVALSWTPPSAAEGAIVRIVRSETGPPTNPDEGVSVYLGTESETLDRRLSPKRYFYAAFVDGADPEETPPAQIVVDLSRLIDPFADSVVESSPLSTSAFQANLLPGIVTGPPQGGSVTRGSLHVMSLGAAENDDGGNSPPYGGSITVEFTDNRVWDGPGEDFTVFENVFFLLDQAGNPDSESRFMEPATVSVSQDGSTFIEFPIDFAEHNIPGTEDIDVRDPFIYSSGFAGVNPVFTNGYDPDPSDPTVSGGDSFDIGELGLDWIRFVRIQSTGHRWLVDGDGDLVLHNDEAGALLRNAPNSGFDLDAVGAIWIEKVSEEP